MVVARSGERASAARLLGFVLKLHSADRIRLGPRQAVFEQLQTILLPLLATHEGAGHLKEGAGWTEAEAAAAAVLLCERATG